MFAKPGLVMATPPGTGGLPTSLRAAGASTIFFDLKLATRVGTPDAPADPATIADTANREFDAAAKQTGCATPLIAENELFGSGTQTPWSPGNAQYRANVLALLTQLTARGAHTFLLISSPPYGGDTAGDWWRAVAQVSDIVREFFPSAPEVSAAGPIAGSRTLRSQMRQAVAAFTSIGVPASRLGLMLEFESGIYGRNGIKTASDWFDYVKLDALAAREVSAELGLPTVWSWGWATYTGKSPFDADKQAAACVYLWTRSPSLCDGPAAAGANFDSSLTEGQLSVPARVFCTLGASGVIAAATRAQLTAVTGDTQAAGSIALGWGATRAAAPVTGAQTDAAERAVIDASFGGSRTAYLAALARRHANRGLARATLAAELRRAAVSATLAVPPVSATSDLGLLRHVRRPQGAARDDEGSGPLARRPHARRCASGLRTGPGALDAVRTRGRRADGNRSGLRAGGRVGAASRRGSSLAARAPRSWPPSRRLPGATRTSPGCSRRSNGCSGQRSAQATTCPSAVPVGLEDYLPFLALS